MTGPSIYSILLLPSWSLLEEDGSHEACYNTLQAYPLTSQAQAPLSLTKQHSLPAFLPELCSSLSGSFPPGNPTVSGNPLPREEKTLLAAAFTLSLHS